MKKFFLFLMAAVTLMACTDSNEPNLKNGYRFKTVADLAQLYNQSPQDAEAKILAWEGWEGGGHDYFKASSDTYEELDVDLGYFDNVTIIDYYMYVYSNCHNEMLNWLKAHGSQIKLDGETYNFHFAHQHHSTFATDYKNAISYIDKLEEYEITLCFLTKQEAAYYDKNGELSETAKAIYLHVEKGFETQKDGKEGIVCVAGISLGYASYGR